MSVIIIDKCDNEIIGVITNHVESYILFDLKSGNNSPFNLRINLVEGAYEGVKTINGVNTPIGEEVTISVPRATQDRPYELALNGIVWGGNKNFNGNIDGVPFHFQGNPNKAELVSIAYQPVGLQEAVATK
jgi:hypothetical protein